MIQQLKSSTPTSKPLGPLNRRAVSLSREELVEIGALSDGALLPLVVRPKVPDVSLESWVARRRDLIASRLAGHGGILFRGFGARTPAELEQLAAAFSGELMQYSYRSTPRRSVAGNVYTSTEYPADQSIPMHNEMSYTSTWPQKIWFLCIQAAQQGGETPIADSRRVFARLDPGLRQRFADRGVLYVRHYGKGLDLAWEDVFQTADRAAVERFCCAAGIEIEWKGEGRLRTRQRCQGVARHPGTGELVWFNQAHLFHRSSLDPAVLASLLESFGDELPRDSYYGDGTPIEPSVLSEIRGVYAEESVVFPWQEGDVLLLDNMLAAHGRRPFAGARKIVVAMAEPMAAEDR